MSEDQAEEAIAVIRHEAETFYKAGSRLWREHAQVILDAAGVLAAQLAEYVEHHRYHHEKEHQDEQEGPGVTT